MNVFCSQDNGFSVSGLMIVLAVVSILPATAFSGFQNSFRSCLLASSADKLPQPHHPMGNRVSLVTTAVFTQYICETCKTLHPTANYLMRAELRTTIWFRNVLGT